MSFRWLSTLAVALTGLTSVQAVAATPQNNLTLIPTNVWNPANPSNPNSIELRVYEPSNVKANPAVILAVRLPLSQPKHAPD